MATPCKRSRSTRPAATTFRFQLAVLCLLLLLLVLVVLYLIAPWKSSTATSSGSLSSGGGNPSKAFAGSSKKITGGCDRQRASAREQYEAYLREIAGARSMRVAAESKTQANSKMSLCGELVPRESPSEADAFDVDGVLELTIPQHGTGGQREQVDVVLTRGKGYRWISSLDGDSVGGVHEDVGVQDDFEDYWGKQLKTSLPCCSVIKFTHFDTVDSPWYSRTMSKQLCRAAIAVSRNETFRVSSSTSGKSNSSSSGSADTDDDAGCSSHRLLKNMVVVAHSTGNLHLASAFLYGDCCLDEESSRWIAIQGPMSGTNTANRVIRECRQPNSTWDALTREVLMGFELCPPTNSTKSLALRGTNPADSCLDALYEKAAKEFQARVYANMCGVSPVGILSSSSPRFVALDRFSNHSSKLNDGVVTFDSCRAGMNASEFRSSYASRFYKAEINHDDGRMIHGDGVWGETRKPLKWLQWQF